MLSEEKVVNPPQNPTIKNNRKSVEINSLLLAIPARKPIIKLPVILTVSVPTGIDKK